MASEAGTSSVSMASRLFQAGTSASPGMGGLHEVAPTPSTTAREASKVRSPTTTVEGPSRCAQPRTNRPPLPLEPLDGHRVVPVVGGLLPDALGDRGPGGRHRRLPGDARDATSLGQEVGAPDHHLGGDAPPVGALAAHQAPVDPDHVEAGFGQPLGDVLAPRSHPHHDHFSVLGHGAPRSVPSFHGSGRPPSHRPTAPPPMANPPLGPGRPAPGSTARAGRPFGRPAPPRPLPPPGPPAPRAPGRPLRLLHRTRSAPEGTCPGARALNLT